MKTSKIITFCGGAVAAAQVVAIYRGTVLPTNIHISLRNPRREIVVKFKSEAEAACAIDEFVRQWEEAVK